MSQKRKLLWGLFFIIPLFAFSQEEAGMKQEHPARFTYEVGVGGTLYNGRQSLSPWGRHYRAEYDRAIGFHAQANYVTRKHDT